MGRAARRPALVSKVLDLHRRGLSVEEIILDVCRRCHAPPDLIRRRVAKILEQG